MTELNGYLFVMAYYTDGLWYIGTSNPSIIHRTWKIKQILKHNKQYRDPGNLKSETQK